MAKTKSKVKPKKIVMKDDFTGLPIGPDGKVMINNDLDAVQAVTKAGEIKVVMEVAASSEIYVKDDSGKLYKVGRLNELTATYAMLREKLRDYQVDKELESIKANGFVSDLVERTASRWILDDNDMQAASDIEFGKGETPTPLFQIIEENYPTRFNRIWKRITKRVLDTAALDEAVKEGLLTAKEIEPAFIEYVDTQYVQIKEDKAKKKK